MNKTAASLIFIMLICFAACSNTVTITEPAKTAAEQTPVVSQEPPLPDDSSPVASEEPSVTSISAASRQDLIDFGFVADETDTEAMTLSAISKISGDQIVISFGEPSMCSYSGVAPMKPGRYIENKSKNIRLYSPGEEDAYTVLQYFPESGSDISQAVSEAVINSKKDWEYFDMISDPGRFWFEIDFGTEEIAAYVYGWSGISVTKELTDIVDLQSEKDQAMKLFNEFDDQIMQEFGLHAAQMLWLE